MPQAQSGHSSGVHIVFGSVSSVSSGTEASRASSEGFEPKVSSVPIATTLAPQACKSLSEPCTADPALMTSFGYAAIAEIT